MLAALRKATIASATFGPRHLFDGKQGTRPRLRRRLNIRRESGEHSENCDRRLLIVAFKVTEANEVFQPSPRGPEVVHAPADQIRLEIFDANDYLLLRIAF
jgi:hypothetical protein